MWGLWLPGNGVWGALAAPTDEPVPGETPNGKMMASGRFRDDLTKQPLIDTLVHEARRKELEYFAQKQVWLKVPRQQCYQTTGRPPISVRWVDVNKGDDEHPRYRCRLVARQIKALEGPNALFLSNSLLRSYSFLSLITCLVMLTP